MDAPTGECTFCGQPSRHGHHITGRQPDRTYLHPDLIAELCHRHHVLVHNDLRTLAIDIPDRSDTDPIRQVVFALRRIAAFIGRLATYSDNPLWRPLAAVLEACATTITRHLTQSGTLA